MSAPQTIAELIASLPEEERIILTLHYLGGKSADEIAAQWAEDRRFEPQWSASQREAGMARWREAVDRSRQWAKA